MRFICNVSSCVKVSGECRSNHAYADKRAALGSLEMKGSNFTWSQTITDVTINIPIPEGTSGKQIDWTISTNKLRIGIRGQKEALLEGELCAPVKPHDCTWTVGTLNQVCVFFIVDITC